MSNVSLPWDPQPGQPNDVNQIVENDEALATKINGNINGDNLSADVLNWRPVMFARAHFVAGLVADTYSLSPTDTGAQNFSSSGGARSALTWHPVAAELNMAGRTTQVRVRASLVTNATAPASNFTVALFPVTATAGAAGLITFTLGAAVATVLFTTPSGSTLNRAEGVAVALPSAGTYVLGVTTSATIAASSVVSVSAYLDMRHV